MFRKTRVSVRSLPVPVSVGHVEFLVRDNLRGPLVLATGSGVDCEYEPSVQLRMVFSRVVCVNGDEINWGYFNGDGYQQCAAEGEGSQSYRTATADSGCALEVKRLTGFDGAWVAQAIPCRRFHPTAPKDFLVRRLESLDPASGFTYWPPNVGPEYADSDGCPSVLVAFDPLVKFGFSFHVRLIRVALFGEDPNTPEVLWWSGIPALCDRRFGAVHDPDSYLSKWIVELLNEGRYPVVQVPGYDGIWAPVLQSFGE